MSKTITNIKISDSTIEVLETNKPLVIEPNGTGALVASKTGNSRGTYSVDWQRSRSNNNQVASGQLSVIGGGGNNTTSVGYAVCGGGKNNSASSYYSFIGGGESNSTSNSYGVTAHNVICGGKTNFANGYFGFVGGGSENSASGAYSAYYNSQVGYIIYGHSAVVGGRQNTASGLYSFIGGGLYNTAQQTQSTVGGGNQNIASGILSTVCGGSSNQASGGNSTVCGGSSNQATNNGSIACGGYSNTASGIQSVIGGGKGNSSTGALSIVGGGLYNLASAEYSTIPGGFEAKTTLFAELSHAAGKFSQVGDAQHSILVAKTQTLSGNFTVTIASPGIFTKSNHGLRNGDTITLSTTGSLPTGLNTTTTYYVISTGLSVNNFRISTSLNGSAVNTSGTQSGTHSLTVTKSTLFLNNSSSRMILPAETTWTFTVNLSAHNDTNNDGGWWIIRGGIKRNASNATTLIGSVITEYGTDSNLSTATVSVTADDDTDSLDVSVGGVSAKNIRWVAIIDVSQVSYGTP